MVLKYSSKIKNCIHIRRKNFEERNEEKDNSSSCREEYREGYCEKG